MQEKKSRKKEYASIIFKCLTALLFPFVLCFIFCAIRKTSLFSLYLPNCYNNDCLFYYKITESMVNNGLPLGYFGFTESHALIGSLAAWSPIIFIPWVLWGKLFGISYLSMIICNICIFSIALCLFTLLSRIEWKQLLCLFVLFLCFPSICIHLMVGLPEAIMISVLLLLIGAAVRAEISEKKTWYIIIMLISGIYLTLCRPYMVVFLLLPCFYMVKKKKVAGSVISLSIILGSLAAYFLIGHFFTADYFEPLFDLSLIKLVLQGHPVGALRKFVSSVTTMIPGIFEFCLRSFKTGWVSGTQYIVFFESFIFLIFSSFKKENKEKRPVTVTFLIASFSLFLAIVFFLGKVNEGARHVWCYAIIGLVLIALTEFNIKNIIAKALTMLLLVIFILRWSPDAIDYDIPFPNDELRADISYWQSVFANPDYSLSEDISYDNTLIWVIIDQKDNQSVITDFHELYALPSGMGISCCYADHVLYETDSLKSRYIATVSGGNLDNFCLEQDYLEIGRTDNLVIYARY